MSVTESKVKTPAKTSKKVVKPTEVAALKAALDAAQIEMVPLSALVKSPLNARTIPYPVESVRELADTISSLGLLQNLVVHSLPDGKSGVAAGGRRLTALQLLCDEQRIDTGYRVAVKRVSDELAAAASLAENVCRTAMHPAEQITGFRTLSAQGKTPVQIGDALGYGSRHVQRMLKLACLAPELLARLASDEIDTEQCQALCLESDPARQVEIFGQVSARYGNAPAHLLKRAITETEISVNNPRFMFVGREAYEAAGGIVREDLFSAQDGDGTADSVLIDRLAQEKLDTAAQAIRQEEGWLWSMTRESAIREYGDDRIEYLLMPIPEPVYTDTEKARLASLVTQLNVTDTCEDEYDIQQQIDDLEAQAVNREWTDAQKAACGVVISRYGSDICVQRGVQKRGAPETETGTVSDTSQNSVVNTLSPPDAAEGISLPLLTKMSSERTLAVQAALMQQPQKAVALMVWRLCADVFHGRSTASHPFSIRLSVAHYSLTDNAPSGKDGKAYVALMQEQERLERLLPEGWEQDFTTFFTLDGQVLIALMAFCTACSIEGVQTRENGRTSRSRLDALETAIGFHMRDWWSPEKANFFTHLTKPQIVSALTMAGLSGAASDAGKMNKGDAAELAGTMMANNRWVPDWMCSVAVKKDAPELSESHCDDDANANANANNNASDIAA